MCHLPARAPSQEWVSSHRHSWCVVTDTSGSGGLPLSLAVPPVAVGCSREQQGLPAGLSSLPVAWTDSSTSASLPSWVLRGAEVGSPWQQIKCCALELCTHSYASPVHLEWRWICAPGSGIYLGFGLKSVYLQGQGKEVTHQRAVTDE